MKMRLKFGLLAGLVTGLVWSAAHAADATLTWQHPTQREDNSALPLSEIRETQIDWGRCATGNTFPATPAGTKAVPAPATTTVVTGLDYGTWCFRARSVDTAGLVSNNSGTVWKQYVAPPKPPVLSSTITVAYELNGVKNDGTILLGRAVGTIELGTPCMDYPFQTNKGLYYGVDRQYVTFVREPKSPMVVTQCVRNEQAG